MKNENKYSTWQVLIWFWNIFQQVKLQSFVNTVSSIARVLLDFAFIWATKHAIDIATGSASPSSFGPSTLFQAGVLLVVVMLLQLALGYMGRWMSALLGVEAKKRMQRRLFEHLLRSEWHGKEQRHSGDVLNRLVSDSQTVVAIVTDTLPQVIAVFVRLLCAFAFLFTMDPMLAIGITVILPIFILLSRAYINRMRAITREVRKTDSHIQATLQESIQHRVILKTLGRVQMMVKTLLQLQNTLRQQVRHRTLFSSTSNLVLNLGFGLAYLFTFLWSANRLLEGSITFGMMTAFIQLCGQIQGPFRELTRFIPSIITSFTAAERLMELEEIPLEADGKPVAFTKAVGLRVSDVSFAYDRKNRQVISHANYHFPPGSSTAILGETGAGKTTLIRMILALLKPSEGEIVMYEEGHEDQGVPVSPRTRCNLVYVPQGNTLFSGSLRWNLRLGNPDATEEEMQEALQLACADFVQGLPEGLDTVIGEGGAGLSEGQAQRIAIARSLLKHGAILLLDEATSALDQITEQTLLNNLIEHYKNRPVKPTLIFITHRPAVLQHCSQIITLERQPYANA